MAYKRNKKGQFVKGHGGGPGRPKRKREERYYQIMQQSCTFKDWRVIMNTAVARAKAGDRHAREWLAKYIIGTAPQKLEITGEGGGPIVLVNWDDANHTD